MDKQKTAVIHARVSDKKQADRDLSIPSQIEAGKKRATEIGANVLQIFVEGKARSAWRGNRPELEDAIDFCELHEVDYFITWDTARFSRDTATGPSNRLRLRSAGTFIEYIAVHINPETDEGFILEHIYQLTDELKSRQTSTDTRRSMIKNARAGYWNGGVVPFGFRAVADGKRKRLEENPDESKIVHEIFKLKATKGLGSRGIAIYLNERGSKNRRKKWDKSVIAKMLRNEVVIGKTVFGRKDRQTGRIRARDQWVIADSHEAIIDAGLWKQVQRQLDRDQANTDTGSPHSTYRFTGLLKCGQCGSAMQIESAKGRNKRYWYYNCRASMLERAHPPRRVPARELDEYLTDEICDRIFSRSALESFIDEMNYVGSSWAKDRSVRRKAVVRQIQSIKAKQTRLFEIMEEFGKDTPNLGDLTTRLRQHNTDIRRLEEDLLTIDQETLPRDVAISTDNVDALRDILVSVIKTSENEKKVRDFFSSFISAIFIEDDSIRIEYSPQMIIAQGEKVPSKDVWLPERDLLGTKILKFPLPQRFIRAA